LGGRQNEEKELPRGKHRWAKGKGSRFVDGEEEKTLLSSKPRQ